MIPNINNYDVSIKPYSDKTYKLGNCNVYISGDEAIKQAVYKILNTQRYEYVIYSYNYGIEINDLIGMPYDYIYSEIENRIVEALMVDERILSVDNFIFTKNKKDLYVSFDINNKIGLEVRYDL